MRCCIFNGLWKYALAGDFFKYIVKGIPIERVDILLIVPK